MTEISTDIDTATLNSYLSEELGETITGTEVLNDGLNLMLRISTEKDGRTYVLRRPNKLRHTSYINSLRGEYRTIQKLQKTAIPTQTPVLFCDDDSVIGDAFFITRYLDGATVPNGSDLPERFQNVSARTRAAECLLDTLTEIHSVDIGPFEGACDRQTPLQQVDRATDRLDAIRSVTGREYPTLQAVAEWLRENAPSDPKTTLIHGDFRPGNVLFAGTKQPEITGVLDWETATLGDPLTELGYVLLYWRDDSDSPPSIDELEARYSDEDALRRVEEIHEHGLCPFTTNPGSPSRRELVARYEEKTGTVFENERFYRAHSALLLAMVWEDLHRHRIEAGRASGREPLVDYMAMVAISIVDGEY